MMRNLVFLCLFFCVLNLDAGTGEFADPSPKKKMPLMVLPGTIHRIRLHSVAILQNGTFGFASSAEFGCSSFPLQYGLIYVWGVLMPQGNVWEGVVYPTGKTIRHRWKSYPCYAVSQKAADEIAAAD